MIETEVHQRLRAYLREQGHTQWPHHLTMARLVARALRVGRSALIQTDALAAYQGTHRLSYLIPALLWPEPAVLALPDNLLDSVVQQDIPDLQQSLPVIKPVQVGDRWPSEDFRGLLVTSAQDWLSDRITSTAHNSPPTTGTTPTARFPAHIPTLIDGASELENWVRAQLSTGLSAQDWDALMLAYPGQRAFIRDMRVRLTRVIFQHPANPYSCHLIDAPELDLLSELYAVLQSYADGGRLPVRWQTFGQCLRQTERLGWTQLNRDSGSFTLNCGPTDIAARLSPIWEQQPVVLMGTALDVDKKAQRYRDRLGLGEMTCLQFAPDRHHDLVQIYLPDRLPMPNTSHFQAAILQQIRTLLGTRNGADAHQGPTVIVIGDVPLKAQFASILAAEFGSRVQVESPIDDEGILITGWDYWLSHQSAIAPPGLLIVTTLPIPSLENPLVAGRVATYKRRRQDWFKSYLLPETLSTLQRAIAPVRLHPGPYKGVVALLDNRINHRSYGRQILAQ